MTRIDAIVELSKSLYSDLVGGNLDDESSEVKFQWIEIATEKYHNMISGFNV